MKLLIKGANVVNPAGKSGRLDILTDGEKVAAVGEKLGGANRVIDAGGLTAFPGFVDMHTHLREPGYEYKEDIITGTRAAANGGFTSIACMPNTDPVNDSEAVTQFIIKKAGEGGYARVYPVGAITKGMEGRELSEMGRLKRAGCVAFSDDGRPVMNGGVMRNAMLYANGIGAFLISHCEDLTIVGEGLMNEGYMSTVLGLKGIPRAAEECMVAREILLAESYGCRVHIAHVSTAGGAGLIRAAKARGVRVTAETCPHYVAADDTIVAGYDANTKVNPPIRTKEDVKAIKEALKDGTIDCIVTDHAPHHPDDKNVEYALAANGISGLDTSFALIYSSIELPLEETARLMSLNPAKILGIDAGVIREGGPADITLVDLNAEYVITPGLFESKSKNSPFIGRSVRGRVTHTICRGKLTKADGRVV